MAEESHERLREHPSSRFAAPQHRFDLETITGVLGHEAQAGESGRRQQTLYKHGGTTVALFLFGHFTNLPPHRTEGTVVIHVLKGHLRVTAESEIHDLRAGHMLVLASGIEHGIVAPEESTMLLTVHLSPSAANPPALIAPVNPIAPANPSDPIANPLAVANPPEPIAAPAQPAVESGLRRALARWDNEGGRPASIEKLSNAVLPRVRTRPMSPHSAPPADRSIEGGRACPVEA